MPAEMGGETSVGGIVMGEMSRQNMSKGNVLHPFFRATLYTHK